LLGVISTTVEEEYDLEDKDYTKMKAVIPSKLMHKIEKKIALKIGAKEVRHKRMFDKRISSVQNKLKKISTKIDGINKRLYDYTKTRKELKNLRIKLQEKKRNILLEIKKSKVDLESQISKMEIKSILEKKPVSKNQIEALKMVQENKAKQLVKSVMQELMQNKIQLKQISSKKVMLRRRLASAKSTRTILRNKLVRLLKEKAEYMKKLVAKRNRLIKKAIRYYKVVVLFEKIKLSIKHLEERLDVEINEKRRQKYQSSIEYLNKKMNALSKRIEVLKRRKAERKVRMIEIKKLKMQIRNYLKKYRAERKAKRIELRNSKRSTFLLKKAFKKAEREYNMARSLEKRNKKANALVGARKAYFSAKRRTYNLNKDLRMMKNIKIDKVNAILRGALKLKLVDRKMRIAEHNLSIKEYEQYKAKIIKRLAVLKKYGRRLDLCPINRRILRHQIKINLRRLRHVNRRIRHSQRGIMDCNNRIAGINKRYRMLAIEEYRHMKKNAENVKIIIKSLKRENKMYKFKRACAGEVTKKRMTYLIKSNENELKVLKTELSGYKSNIKRVDDAIKEEKKQRLTVTKIDYHRLKALLSETENGIKKITNRINKNKEEATQTDKIYLRKDLLNRNAHETRKLVKLDSIKKKLLVKLTVLKARKDKLVAQDVSDFLRYKTKWETRREKVLAELRKQALHEKKLTRKLKNKKIDRYRKCKLIYNKKQTYLKAHKLQIQLFRINKKLQHINKEYIRRSEAKSFKMIYKRFNKQKKAYLKVKQDIKHVSHQIIRLEKKINLGEKKLPYLNEKNKLIAKSAIRSLEKIKRSIVAKQNHLEEKKVRILKRYLIVNKEYIIQLKKRMTSNNNRKQELLTKRPNVLHEALYELIPKKQQRNERKLNELDKELEAIEEMNSKDIHSLKEALRIASFLKEAVKPKVTCDGKNIIDCRYCKILGKIVKSSLKSRETDRVILERLTHRCNKEEPKDQTRCLDVAMRITEVALKQFDPNKFKVSQTCKRIGVCGI
jgi:hypothetical protein